VIPHSMPGLTPERVAACSPPLTPTTLALLARVRTRYPRATVDYDAETACWWAHAEDGSGYLCARADRPVGRRCCIGGPCDEPAAGLTAEGALELACRGLA